MLNETFSVIFKQCVTLQKMVILLALPPNWAILSRNHCKAINWSKRSLPGTSSVSKNKRVRLRGNEGKITVLKAHFARIFAHRELCSALVVNFDVSKTMKMMMMRTAKSSRAAVTISCKNVDWLTFHQFSSSSLLCRISQIFNTTAVKSVKMKYHRNCKQQNCSSLEKWHFVHISQMLKNLPTTYHFKVNQDGRFYSCNCLSTLHIKSSSFIKNIKSSDSFQDRIFKSFNHCDYCHKFWILKLVGSAAVWSLIFSLYSIIHLVCVFLFNIFCRLGMPNEVGLFCCYSAVMFCLLCCPPKSYDSPCENCRGFLYQQSHKMSNLRHRVSKIARIYWGMLWYTQVNSTTSQRAWKSVKMSYFYLIFSAKIQIIPYLTILIHESLFTF